MQIPVLPAQVLEALHHAGHQAYLVGGCVRDMLLSREPKDWDIATDARPQRIQSLFPGGELVGAHFGVILWRGVEIATFRSDGPYLDGRRPESVQFETDPAKDAGRRDFTINGLFYDSREGRILDFVDGQADLAGGVIRAIGDPAARFAEDYLRMLRAVRFASRFRFDIEPETRAAISAFHERIVHVAAERTRDELTGILTGRHPRRGVELLDELGLLAAILPEAKAMQGVEQPPEFHPEGDVWTHTMMMLGGLRESPVMLAWSVLLHDIAKPRTYTKTDRIRFNGHAPVGATMSGEILRRLRYPAHTIETVQAMVAQHLLFIEVRRMRESTRRRFLRQEFFADLLELHRLDSVCSSGNLDAYQYCRDELARMPPEALRPRRLLTGSDLLAMGIQEGPEIGRILLAIEDAQLEGAVDTEAQARAMVESRLAGSGK